MNASKQKSSEEHEKHEVLAYKTYYLGEQNHKNDVVEDNYLLFSNLSETSLKTCLKRLGLHTLKEEDFEEETERISVNCYGISHGKTLMVVSRPKTDMIRKQKTVVKYLYRVPNYFILKNHKRPFNQDIFYF